MASLPSQPTQLLVKRASEGDQEATNLLCARLLPRLQSWAQGRLPAHARSLKDTHDVVSEVFLRSIRRLDGFQESDGGSFLGYVQKGILNQIRNEIRRARNNPTVQDLPDLVESKPSALEELVGRESLEKFDQALEELKPEEQEILRARLELDMTYQEIALHLGKPSPDAARMAVKRAIRKLAQGMSKDDEP